MAKISGVNVHRARLARMRRVSDPALIALYDQGETIRNDAANSIIEGSVSGPAHKPSAPGSPPNRDTGNLDKSIDVRINKSRKTVSVIARAEYAAAQEFGTSTLPARPFMRPALQRNKDRVVFGVVKAVNDVNVKVFKGQVAFDRSRAKYEDGG